MKSQFFNIVIIGQAHFIVKDKALITVSLSIQSLYIMVKSLKKTASCRDKWNSVC